MGRHLRRGRVISPLAFAAVSTLTSEKVKHIRQAVEESGIEPEPLEKKILGPSIQGVPFFWGPTGENSGNLQPLPSQVPYIWEIFVENVDPFVKILHVPTIGKAIKEVKGELKKLGILNYPVLISSLSLSSIGCANGACTDIGKFNSMSRGMESLMFAISLAAVTSLREDEVCIARGAHPWSIMSDFDGRSKRTSAKTSKLLSRDLGSGQNRRCLVQEF